EPIVVEVRVAARERDGPEAAGEREGAAAERRAAGGVGLSDRPGDCEGAGDAVDDSAAVDRVPADGEGLDKSVGSRERGECSSRENKRGEFHDRISFPTRGHARRAPLRLDALNGDAYFAALRPAPAAINASRRSNRALSSALSALIRSFSVLSCWIA